MRRSRQTKVTVADLTRDGVDAVEASCPRCGEQWTAPIGFLPPATTFDKIVALMICPTCGGRDVEIQEHVQAVGRSIQ